MNNLQFVKACQAALWDDKNLAEIDQYFDHDVLVHSPVKTTQGSDQLREVISKWHQGFPNLKVYCEDFITEQDKIVCRWQAEGRHEGTFLTLPATNKNISYSGVTIFQLMDGKIKQYWAFVDMDHIKKQL